MRLAPSHLLALVLLALIAPEARTQLDLPLADYDGSLRLALTCPDGSTTKLKTKGVVGLDAQAGTNILASAEFTGKRAGVDCTVTLDMTGVVNAVGRVLGTYTSTIECSDGAATAGSGVFEGRYMPGRLAFILEGQDDACQLFGKFKGKGSPGTALCAVLTLKTVSKLGKRFYSGWSRWFKVANVATSSPVLQAAVQKAQAAFAKASEGIAKKTEKAGGSCSKPPTAPGNLTKAIKEDTLDPMAVGFLAGRPLDRFARSRMAKIQGRYFAARLKIELAFIMKLDPVKRIAALKKARESFTVKSSKLLLMVTELGLNWTGPSPQGMAQDIEELTDALVAFYL